MIEKLLNWIETRGINGKPPTVGISPVMMADSVRLESLENYAPTRNRRRMSFKTTDVNSFCNYINEEGIYEAPALITVDEQNITAAAIFNHTELGHCDDVASCEVVPLPPYQELLDLNIKLTQEELLDWITDWSSWIQEYAKLHKAITKVTAKQQSERDSEVGDWNREQSSMEKSTIESGGGKPPSEIIFKFNPYTGFDEKLATIKLTGQASDGKVVFRLRVMQLEQLKLDIAHEFIEIIAGKCGQTPFLGTIKKA